MKSERTRRIARDKKRRAGSLLSTRAGKVLLMALLIIISLIFGREFIGLQRKNAEKAALQTEREREETNVEQMQKENNELKTPQRSELEAREKLHKTRPDEILIVPGNTETTSQKP
jgi:hypothetical protein